MILHSFDMNLFFNEPNTLILGLLLTLISYIITFRMIPVIIATVSFKKLHVQPNARSSHSSQTPTLGGIAFLGA